MLRWCFYETTNIVNGKKYLGIHGSEDFKNDTYLGSGTLLKEAIRKYGKDKFFRKDIRYFNKQKDARDFEALSITPEVLRSPEYYNIARGGGGGSNGSRPFYEGSRRYLVDPEAVDKFKKQHPEAIEGVPEEVGIRHSKRMVGRITINNGKEHRSILQEDLQKYLDKGWTVGTTQELNLKNSNSKKGIRIMHFGDQTRHVRLQDVERFLQDGYSFGPSKWISRQNGQSHRGKVRIYKGQEIKYVSKDLLGQSLKEGWCQGTPETTKQKYSRSVQGRIYINNNVQEAKVPDNEVQEYLKLGWSLGRLSSTYTKLAERNKNTKDIRKRRAKEEAETRRVIYTCSSEYLKWWEEHKEGIGRIHYGVSRFLKEKHTTKEEFLNHMRSLGEYK